MKRALAVAAILAGTACGGEGGAPRGSSRPTGTPTATATDLQFRWVLEERTRDDTCPPMGQPVNPAPEAPVVLPSYGACLSLKAADVAAREVRDVGVHPQPDGTSVVRVTLTEPDARAYEVMTEFQAGRIAVVFQGAVVSAPMVRRVVRSGTADLTGNFTKAQADALATRLRGVLVTATPTP